MRGGVGREEAQSERRAVWRARVVGVAKQEDAVGDLAPNAAQLAQGSARRSLLERQAMKKGLAPTLLQLACYLEDARRTVAPAQLPQPLLR